MEVTKVNLKGVLLIKPTVFEDKRGYFFESYNKKEFKNIGIEDCFVQDNQSMSDKDVLRGLHFQKEPFAQGKLVRVLLGSVLDVVVDIRKDSPTYGEHFKQVLSSDNKLTLWIPSGFAHGFLTLEDHSVFSYKCTGFYKKEAETSILWNDPDLDINWAVANPIVSDKDRKAMLFKDF